MGYLLNYDRGVWDGVRLVTLNICSLHEAAIYCAEVCCEECDVQRMRENIQMAINSVIFPEAKKFQDLLKAMPNSEDIIDELVCYRPKWNEGWNSYSTNLSTHAKTVIRSCADVTLGTLSYTVGESLMMVCLQEMGKKAN